ncbi:MAG: VTC domain-containing protein [Gemmatimonadota bacterium]
MARRLRDVRRERFAPPSSGGRFLRHATDTESRYEVKYLVRATAITDLARALEGYVEPDPRSDPEWGYSVYSVYWDSPDWRLFWEKVEGLKDRRKLRFRRYGGSSDVVVEIKHRIDRTLEKRRLRWPAERVREVLGPLADGRLPDAIWEATEPVVGEVAAFVRANALRPRMAVLYRRRAWFGVYEPNVRITFDSRLQYRATGFDLVTPFEVGKYVLDPRAAVMEVKFTGRVPLWLSRFVTRHSLQMVRLSKYCAAVDKEYHAGMLT